MVIRNTHRESRRWDASARLRPGGGYRTELPGRREKTMAPEENSARGHLPAGAVERDSV